MIKILNLPGIISPNWQALRKVAQKDLSRKTGGFEAVQGILLFVYYWAALRYLKTKLFLYSKGYITTHGDRVCLEDVHTRALSKTDKYLCGKRYYSFWSIEDIR